jgi:hypothetical protein
VNAALSTPPPLEKVGEPDGREIRHEKRLPLFIHRTSQKSRCRAFAARQKYWRHGVGILAGPSAKSTKACPISMR